MQCFSTSRTPERVMKVKSKLMAALVSLKDQGQNLLSNIEVAVLRATDHHETPLDDKYVHEILFLVSNAPGSITFLARKISSRLETTRIPVVALKTLVLLHRLLRGGDRYFEQDLRNLCSSGDLRMDVHWLSPASNPLSSFVIKYSLFLEERIWWVINQAGKLEPTTPPSSEFQSYEEEASELVLYRLSKCQAFLDLIMDCLPVSIPGSSHVGQLAMSSVLRESFRVYESFCDGVEIVGRFFDELNKHARVLALDILKKACTQTPKIQEFYDDCKRSVVGMSLDYPSVQILTSDLVSSMESSSPTKSDTTGLTEWTSKEENTGQKTKEEPCEASMTLFSQRLETKISTVWVDFDEEDYLLGEGESSTTRKARDLL